MSSVTNVPPSIVILVDRIEYWKKERDNEKADEVARFAYQLLIDELTLVLDQVKEKV